MGIDPGGDPADRADVVVGVVPGRGDLDVVRDRQVRHPAAGAEALVLVRRGDGELAAGAAAATRRKLAVTFEMAMNLDAPRA